MKCLSLVLLCIVVLIESIRAQFPTTCANAVNIDCSTDAYCQLPSLCTCVGTTATCNATGFPASVTFSNCTGLFGESCQCTKDLGFCTFDHGPIQPNGYCDKDNMIFCSTSEGGCITVGENCSCSGTTEICAAGGSGSLFTTNKSACPSNCSCYRDLGPCYTRPCVNDDECNDFVYCNGQEVCSGTGSCVPGPLPCDDGLFCNGWETCNETTQTCGPVLNIPNCTIPGCLLQMQCWEYAFPHTGYCDFVDDYPEELYNLTSDCKLPSCVFGLCDHSPNFQGFHGGPCIESLTCIDNFGRYTVPCVYGTCHGGGAEGKGCLPLNLWSDGKPNSVFEDQFVICQTQGGNCTVDPNRTRSVEMYDYCATGSECSSRTCNVSAPYSEICSAPINRTCSGIPSCLAATCSPSTGYCGPEPPTLAGNYILDVDAAFKFSGSNTATYAPQQDNVGRLITCTARSGTAVGIVFSPDPGQNT